MNTVSEDVLQYLAYCRYEKNLNRLSIKAYRQDLGQFTSFVGKDCQTNQVSKDSVRDYIRDLFHRELKHTSIRRKVASLKAFFKYLEFEDQIQVSPFRKMNVRIKIPETVPRYLSLPEVKSLFLVGEQSSTDKRVFSRLRTFCGAQQHVIIELLFSTGIRVSELCNLDINDVSVSKQSLMVSGKGSRERIVQITNHISLTRISDFLMLRTGLQAHTDALLLNRCRKRLQPYSVRALLRSMSSQARLPFVARPHMFRHTVATLLIENGVDMRFVQKLLGHSAITTTQMYTHPSTQAEREILSMKHPRNFI